jgi:hypothetical protein
MSSLVEIDSHRSFSFTQCDWLGFDLDHTLLRYNVPNLDRLIMRSLLQYLTLKHTPRYPDSLMQLVLEDNSTFCNAFIFKGLVLDKQAGNLLQIDADKVVVRYVDDDEMVGVGYWLLIHTMPIDDQ